MSFGNKRLMDNDSIGKIVYEETDEEKKERQEKYHDFISKLTDEVQKLIVTDQKKMKIYKKSIEKDLDIL